MTEKQRKLKEQFDTRRNSTGGNSTGTTSTSKPASTVSVGSSNNKRKQLEESFQQRRNRTTVIGGKKEEDEKVRAFFRDAKNYLNEMSNASSRASWGNTMNASNKANHQTVSANWKERANWVRSYLRENKDAISQDQYLDFVKQLNSFDSALKQISRDRSNAEDFFSQWKSEKEYSDWKNGQIEYNKLKTFDIQAGEREIGDLEKVLSEYKSTIRNATSERDMARAGEIAKQYGDADSLSALISDKKAYLNRAKYIQEGISMAGVINNDDFEAKSGYVSTKSDDRWSRLTSELGMGYDDITYEYINGEDSGIRQEIINKAVSRDVDTARFFSYDYMTDDQISTYNYYYARDGKEAADRYLNSIQETLNYQAANDRYEKMEGKTGLELIFGIEAGADQFQSGIRNLFNTEDDYIAQTATQMASGMVREDLADDGAKLPKWLGGASLGQVGYDAITTTVNMAPTIMTSTVLNAIAPGVGSAVGTAMMGASAAGNAYQEMLNLGYDKRQSRIYSTLVGASEAGLQSILGGISSLGGKISGDAITKMMNGIDNAFLRTAIKFAGNMASEGLEEGLQEIITPWLKNMVMHTNESINWSEVAYSSLLGALTASVMEGPNTISNAVSIRNTGKNLQNADISAQRLADLGKTFSADTVAYQLAGRVTENTGAYTMGRLFNEIGATLTEQNVNEITSALVAKGMDLDTASKNAKVLAYVVEGGQLSKSDIAKIETNEVLAEAVKTTIIDANTTWNQRARGYNEALMALAQEKVSGTNSAQQTQENAPIADTVVAKNKNGTESLSEAVDTSPAKVKSIASVKDGHVTVKLEDGTEVNLKEADLSVDDGVRIDTIAKLDGISAADANFILNTLRTNTSTSAQMDSLGAREAYKYGYYGFSQDHMTTHGVFANSLTDAQRQAIYKTGQNARAAQVAAQQATVAKNATSYNKVTNKGTVHFEGNRESLTARQSASLNAMERIANTLGVQIYVFESKLNDRGQRVGANGWYDHKDGSIHIDLHAGQNGEGTMLFTAAHELTHHIHQWSQEKFKTLSDFLMQEYGKQGVNVDALVREQINKAKRNKRDIDYDTAYEEVIADSMETMLSDGNVINRLEKLKAQDLDLWHRIKKFIDDLAAKIKAAYKGLAPDSEEGKIVAQMGDAVYRLQELFTEGLVDASKNFQSAEKNTTEDGGVKYQARNPESFTVAETQVIQNIGRKSIYAFSSADIKATEKLARRYWKEMGTKSPFFRAWFGDWRENDSTPVQIADSRSDARGVQRNEDTGWNIQVSGKVFSETKSHTDSYNIAARPYLPYINDIVRKAVLLDTWGFDKAEIKSENSLLMHSLYAVADIGKGREVLKLYVEEMNDPSQSDTSKRAYQLQNVEKYRPTGKSSQKTASSISPVAGNINTVADLFATVKLLDKTFVPLASSTIVNTDGTPKVVYHGTEEAFDVFSYGHIGNATGTGILGDGFYFTDKKNLAKGYGKNIYPIYLRMKNPYTATESDAYKLRNASQMQALGYDGVVLHAPNGAIYMVYDNTQIKSASDNVGTFDRTDSNIKYSDRDTESVSSRSLLANAFEGVAQNDIERQKLQDYKGKIDLINSEERKLADLNQKIKDLSFSKGPKDTKAIRDLQFQAKQTANRISTYDKQLLTLEASKPLQNVLQREKKKAYQRAEQKGKEDLEAYRKKALQAQQELQDKWEESRRRGVEGRQKTAMRNKIKNVVNELNQYLLKGTKDRHVPIELQKAVAEALDAVDMDTVGAEERIAKLEAELLRSKSTDRIQEISRRIDHIREMGDKMSDKLKHLKEAYDDIINSDDPLIANSHDDGISAHMMTLIVRVGDTPLRDMTLSQLEDVYDVYRMVLTTIRNANKAFKAKKSESISVIANRVMNEVKKVGGKTSLSRKGTEGVKSFIWNNLKPVYAFEHIGSEAFTEVFNAVRAGEDVWAVDVTEARDFYLDKSKKHGYDSWDLKKRYKFTSTAGMDFELDLEQIMSLYAYSKREQAADHLKRGGIVIDETTEITMKNKLGIPVKFNPTEATAYNISDATLAEIISKLTADQKDFVDVMQDYLSTVMGNKGNEVSLEMYGIKLFKEKNYFPLKSSTVFMAKAEEQQKGEVKIKNSGFSKETTPNASNPIVLTPFMNVWADHVNEMSMYHAFVLPMEDFYRVFDYKTSTSETSATESVKMYIQNAYGKGATQYISQLLKDLNGGARTDSTTGIINKLMGLFKKGAVFASMSVVVQQPSAIARAAALIDTKYFIGPKIDSKSHNALWNEVKKYAPVAIIKEMGYFDTNMGKSTQDFILGKEYETFSEKMKALFADSDYRDEQLSKAPALADEIAWCGIWEAVKRETKAKYPGLDVKAEPFLKLAGSRFTEVIVKTQVYDSVLSRSGLMRSKDTGMKMATAFMAEPTTSINMIADALLKGKRGNRKYARGAIGAVIASQILNSILVSFVYAGRDDDEDETYAEKYIGTLTGEILDSLNPAGYIPFINDIISIVKGYDVERSDMAVISDLWKAIENLKKDTVSPYRKVEGFAGSIGQIFGLPVKNLMRDARGIYQTIMSFVNGEQTTKAGTKYAVKSALPALAGGGDVSKQEQLYIAYTTGDVDHAERVKSRYTDQKSINTVMRSAIKEHYLAGDIDADTAQQYLVNYCSNEKDEAFWKVEEWKQEANFGEVFGKYDEFYGAVQTGKDLKTVIKKYTDNGVSVETLKSQITEYFKPLFLKMSTSEKAGIKGYLINAMTALGDERENATEKISKWEFESKYGFNYENRKEYYLNGDITADQLRNAVMTFGGKSQVEADKYITELDFEAEYGFAYDDKKEAYLSGKISYSEMKDILMDVGGKTEEIAVNDIAEWQYKADHPELADHITYSQYKRWETDGKPNGVSIELFTDVAEFRDDGTSASAKSQEEVAAYINSLPISTSQKDALWCCFWKESTLKKAPWR